MAQIPFRINLNAAQFPFLTELGPQTIIIPGVDQTDPRSKAFSGSDESRDFGIPQIFYCHNVLPTGQGFMSVGYKEQVTGLPGAADFDQCMEMRDIDENRFLFSPARGRNYVWTANRGSWLSTNPVTPGTFLGRYVTRSNLNGRTFICYETTKVIEYDSTLDAFVDSVYLGITFSDIIGILASNNYNICYSKDTIFWSSLINELDFIPSLSTGAGQAIPQDLKGPIIAVLPISGGFIIYTTKNAVSAIYSNNVRFPWIFKEVANSGGIASPEHVTYEANLGTQYAWTSAGLQEVSIQGAKVIQPELTDFLGSKRYEDYDPSTFIFTSTNLGDVLNTKLALVDNRYLVLSYGVESGLFTYCVVYDSVLKRWGKLRITHTDCFDYPYPNRFGITTYGQLTPQTYADLLGTSYYQLSQQQLITAKAKTRFAFLQQDGTIKLVDFKFASVLDAGVCMFGKFQLTRTRFQTLQEIQVETVNDTDQDFVVRVHKTLDGKTLLPPVVPFLSLEENKYREYNCRIANKNFITEFYGTFNLTGVVLVVSPDGVR
jgi:hypothetical protein